MVSLKKVMELIIPHFLVDALCVAVMG